MSRAPWWFPPVGGYSEWGVRSLACLPGTAAPAYCLRRITLWDGVIEHYVSYFTLLGLDRAFRESELVPCAGGLGHQLQLDPIYLGLGVGADRLTLVRRLYHRDTDDAIYLGM